MEPEMDIQKQKEPENGVFQIHRLIFSLLYSTVASCNAFKQVGKRSVATI
jgi:hypothetical protein